MDRAEHMGWAKGRALEYADLGDNAGAVASLRSDLGEHPDTAASCLVIDELMFPLMLTGNLSRPGEMRKFIEGFS
jgi:hypothetical protein